MPATPVQHVGLVGPRTVDGVRLVGLPYAIVSRLTDAYGGHDYEVFFRLDRPTPGFTGRPSSQFSPVVPHQTDRVVVARERFVETTQF